MALVKITTNDTAFRDHDANGSPSRTGSGSSRGGTATNVLKHTPEHGWRMLIANPQGIA